MEAPARRRVLLDCDPGHDDAVAILLAARHLDVAGITTIGGNQSLEKVTRNALRVLALAGITDIPVAAGMECPLVERPRFAERVHGETGLDGADLPEPAQVVDPRHGVDFIVEALMAEDGITLVPTGPLTNIATAIRKEPRICPRIREISLMGGAFGTGNVTAAAEFNAWCDPEAAHIVFTSGVPIRMCGLNVTRQASAGIPEIGRIRAIGNPVARAVADLIAFYRESTARVFGTQQVPIHDACAVAAIIQPSLFEFRPMHVAVELRGEHTRGMTICDARFPPGSSDLPGQRPANAEVALGIDREGFFDLLSSTLSSYG